MWNNVVWKMLLPLLWISVAAIGLAQKPQAPVTAIAVSPDGKQIVFARSHQLLQCPWDHPDQTEILTTRVNRILKLRFSAGGKILFIAGGIPGESGTVEKLEMSTGRSVWFKQLHDDVVHDFDLGLDYLITASHDQSCKVVRRSDADIQNSFEGHSRPVTGIRFLGKLAVSTGVDQSIRIWDPQQIRELRNLDNHRAAVHALVSWQQPNPADPDGLQEICCTVSQDKTIRFWQPMIGRMIRFCQMKSGYPLCLTHAPNPQGDQEVYVGTSDGRLLVIDFRTAHIQLSTAISTVGIEVIVKHPVKKHWVTGDAAGELKITKDPRNGGT